MSVAQSGGTVVSIVEETPFVYAEILVRSGVRLVHVYRSVVIQDTDEQMKPIYEYLNEVCFDTLSRDEVKDERMMFGKAIRTVYRVFSSCPGEHTDHCCYRAKIRREGMRK